jgi:cytochrome c oxidase subunit 2
MLQTTAPGRIARSIHAAIYTERGPGTVFTPITPHGKEISDLFIFTLVLGGIVFLLVTGLLLYAMVTGRRRAAQEGLPRQVGGNTKLEFAWTAAPAALVIALFIPTVIVMNSSDPAKVNTDKPDMIIIGHQWWWEYQYPKLGVVTANEFRLPVINDPNSNGYLIHLKSADVQHDFWVPSLGRKIDVYPDKENFLYFKPQQTGTYLGVCAEYCGQQHAWMRINVTVQSQADFDSWIASQKAPQTKTAPAASGGQTQGDPVRGEQVFLNNTCVNCHAITGTAATSPIGPNLTHLGSRATLGTGIIENNPPNLKRWLTDPSAIKPGIRMPGYQMSQQDLNDLVAYLEEQK